jgi:hypothetical protein
MKQDFTVRQGALDGLETLLAVEKQRPFCLAAAALGVTPPAMPRATSAGFVAHIEITDQR